MVAQRIEDDPRVAAPDIQDVRPDRERVVQPDRLLEQVRQRQQRDDPVLHRRDQAVERLDRRDLVVVGEHDALRTAGRAGGEDELEDVAGGGRIPAGELGLPVRREGVIGFGRDRAERGGREAVQAGLARIRGVAALAEDEMARARDADDALDRVGRHAQVERDQDEAGAHRAEVGRRQLGGRGRPGQQPIAGLETERAQAPGRDPRATIELAIAPGRRRAVIEAKAQGGLVAVGRDGRREQVEQGLQGRASIREGPIVRRGQHPNVSPAAASWRTVPDRHDGSRRTTDAGGCVVRIHVRVARPDRVLPGRRDPGPRRFVGRQGRGIHPSDRGDLAGRRPSCTPPCDTDVAAASRTRALILAIAAVGVLPGLGLWMLSPTLP